MGDFTKCISSVERPLSGAGVGTEAAGAEPAKVRDSVAVATIISGMEARVMAPADGFFSRIRKSPCEYSNSSRLCSLMKRSNCSICPISGLANDGLPLAFDRFLLFMPFSEFDEIPLDAGQDFASSGMHYHAIFDPDSPDVFPVYARFYGNHISSLQSSFLPPGDSRLFMHFQAYPMAGAVHKKRFQMMFLQDLSRRGVHFPAGNSSLNFASGCLLRFQNPRVPSAYFAGSPPQIHRARHVAAIVAEYNTQV